MSKETYISGLAWDEIQWPLVIADVRCTQRRIYRASKKDNKHLVRFLQKQLMMSPSASLLATYTVTTLNKGKKTAGIDGLRNLNSKQKLELAKNLRLNGSASGIKRVWIPKPGTQDKRPLGIPIMLDRAKQALAKLVLEPEWEARFENNSYGFRPGRSTHDAIEAIFTHLHHNDPKFVFDADIKKCFDRINHEKLLIKLNSFPLMEKQIRAWLKAGIFDNYSKEQKSFYPEFGTPQGGIISPLLCNIALHGLENHLKELICKVPNHTKAGTRGKRAKLASLGIIRYADDFLLIHRDKETLEICIQETKKWLNEIGLEISNEKSKLISSNQSFNFLGFQIITILRNQKFKVKISPSKRNKDRLVTKVREIIQSNKSAASYSLIAKLRPVIIGWGNYYQFCECKESFSKMDDIIFNQLRAWVFRRSNRVGRELTKIKYFPEDRSRIFQGREYKSSWILEGTKANSKGIPQKNFLPRISWIKSQKYCKIKLNASPYDGDNIYWSMRIPKYSTLSTRRKNLLMKQKAKCLICGIKFNTGDTMEVDHIIPTYKGGKDVYKNLQLLHKHCHLDKTRKDLAT
jgi:RNA-directed DNA polymerase